MVIDQVQSAIQCSNRTKARSFADVRARAALSYLFLKSLKSGSAAFCIANFFLLSKKIETLSIILKNIQCVLKMVIIHLSAAVKE